MNLFDRVEDYLFWAITSIATALAGAVMYMIRLVFTSQAQIEMTQAHLKNLEARLSEYFQHRDTLRAEDREDVAEIKADVKVLLRHIRPEDDNARHDP